MNPYDHRRHNSPSRYQYLPYSNAKAETNYYRSSNPIEFRQSKQVSQEFLRVSAPQSYSRIGELNDRVTMETELIRRRNEAKRKNFDTRSSSSEMRRSRMSADRRRRNLQFEDYGRSSNHQPLRYQSETQSLQNSRASQQLLSKPIISYANPREPLVFSNNQQPIFRKQKSNQNEQFNFTKPILQKPSIERMNPVENEHVPHFRTSNYSDSHRRPENQKYEQFEEFLDMDFNRKKPVAESRRSRDFYEEEEPVSPVTYTDSVLKKRKSETMEAEAVQTAIGKAKPIPPPSLANRVTGLMSKVDYDGKIVTVLLVGLGIILVLFQLIR